LELRFVLPQLSKLDEIDGEILVASIFSDVRPVHGVAGLSDFRLCGRLSRLMRSGFLSGAFGEVVMIPGKPRLTYDKVLVFGAGPRAAFDEDAYTALLRRVLGAMQGLMARTGVVELPGRQDGAIGAARAADILLCEIGGSPLHDVWTLVEDADGRASIEQHMVEQKRRVRRSF
jgi:hypothetical protein